MLVEAQRRRLIDIDFPTHFPFLRLARLVHALFRNDKMKNLLL